MSFRQQLQHSLLKLPLSLLVRSTAAPSSINDYHIDLNKPIVYALPFDSNVDLLTLKKQALTLGLPDPLEPLIINNATFPRFVFIATAPTIVPTGYDAPKDSIQLFSQFLELHKLDPNLDIQMIPVSVLWGRKPGKEKDEKPHLQFMNSFQKSIAVVNFGRDCLVRFSPSVSIRYMADYHGTDTAIAHKLARVARIHFSRQKLAASGPNLPQRDELFARLIKSPTIEQTIIETAKHKKVPLEKIRKEAYGIMDEIAANFSYNIIKHGDRLLRFLWTKIYKGIRVNNAATVRKLAQDGHEIVYLPCHRSHMDYLLLSYILYKEGLVPPHIAAGVNLNFFPAGSIFRRGGAFFIRRSFKGNKLYSTIFNEYLVQLFMKGYSVEYFSEGGRSRTGRLLPAKTGMLSMTLQAMLRGLNRHVTIVPVYIGYEHVMEVATYSKELRGKRKEKENAGLVLRTIRKLRNFGLGYVNFGEPISLNQYLNEQVVDWKKDINKKEHIKPEWLNPVVNSLAQKIMTNINSAAAVSAMSLCATALLASPQRALSRDALIMQINFYTQLLKNLKYSDYITIEDQSADNLVDHAISLKKFIIETDSMGDIVSLDRSQSILMTYYRNNIIHLLVLPSLIAQIIVSKRSLELQALKNDLAIIYPFLQNELFLHYNLNDLDKLIEKALNEFALNNMIFIDNDQILINQSKNQPLVLLGQTIVETLQRYSIVTNLLLKNATMTKVELEQKSQDIAQRLGRLHNINAPEFFDKGLFSTMLNSLKQQGYIEITDNFNQKKIQSLTSLVSKLLNPDVKLTIEESIY